LKNIEVIEVSMFADDIVVWPSVKITTNNKEPWRKLFITP
jgi:hypothetical protein